jgi:hypothetical protein
MTLSQIVNLCANTKPSIKLSVYVKIDTILSDNMTFHIVIIHHSYIMKANPASYLFLSTLTSCYTVICAIT